MLVLCTIRNAIHNDIAWLVMMSICGLVGGSRSLRVGDAGAMWRFISFPQGGSTFVVHCLGAERVLEVLLCFGRQYSRQIHVRLVLSWWYNDDDMKGEKPPLRQNAFIYIYVHNPIDSRLRTYHGCTFPIVHWVWIEPENHRGTSKRRPTGTVRETCRERWANSGK